jgi:hypothetical protein
LDGVTLVRRPCTAASRVAEAHMGWSRHRVAIAGPPPTPGPFSCAVKTPIRVE